MSFKFIRWCNCWPSARKSDATKGSSKERHRIRVFNLGKGRGKKLLLLDHTSEEVASEMTIAALSGPACPCVKTARATKEYKAGKAVVVGRDAAE